MVSEQQLEALFARGLHPATGGRLGRAWRTDGVTGFDLTFSAPKSVSALWALGDRDSAGLSAAVFDHRSSRAGDPQLHTHALVLNKVRCADGRWRTLDASELFHHKSAGMIYQATSPGTPCVPCRLK